MNDITTARMLMTTAVVAAVAALFAGSANAVLLDVEGGSGGSATEVAKPGDPGTIPYLSHGIGVDKSLFSGQASSQATDVAKPGDPGTIPYLSHGIGVDKSLFSGQASSKLTGVHAALQRDRGTESAASSQRTTLPHGIGVETSGASGQTSLGLTGDSALTRVADESHGLTGDSPIGRFPGTTQTAVASGGEDLDWSSFGAGAGLVALVGAGIAGVWLTTRRRGGVALP
jgi:hypothetical protein